MTVFAYSRLGKFTVPKQVTALFCLLALASSPLGAAETPISNAGDTAWVLLGALLVLAMTIPGLSLFYGGLVRRQHVLGTMMQSLAITAVVSVAWAVCGYGLAFGRGGLLYGSQIPWFLEGVAWTASGGVPGPDAAYAATIPAGAFCFFQLMFACITPAVICGAYAERMRFSASLLFSLLWLFVVYIPLAHLVWSADGALNWAVTSNRFPVFDFAGGTVVETASGVSGLVCAIYLGRRRRYLEIPMPPHNLAFAFTGAALLWVGWFGFNAGSALTAGGLATLACINTHLAAAAATLTWPAAEWCLRGKPTVLGAISGAVAGLVAITPACGFVSPLGALAIGAVAGALCFAACAWMKMRLGYDDSLDVFGVHGVAGMMGTLATGLFLVPSLHPGIKDANPTLYAALSGGSQWAITGQAVGVAVAILLAVAGSLACLWLTDKLVGIRITADDEAEGLDLSQHGEEAYNDRE